MTQTITERVYDELTHKLRQWEKLAPAPHELLGALKSWSQIGNADIEAAANAAAGLAVKGSQRSVKAFANVPDVPAALAHLRTAHAALKAQVNAEHNAPPRSGGFAGVKAVTAEDAAQDMLKLSAKFEAIAQQIQAANGFGAASRLFVGARRFYQASIAKYGQFWSPDMQRIMKNTLDRVSIGAARDSSDPQWFLYHSMVTAANRARNWSSDVRRSAG